MAFGEQEMVLTLQLEFGARRRVERWIDFQGDIYSWNVGHVAQNFGLGQNFVRLKSLDCSKALLEWRHGGGGVALAGGETRLWSLNLHSVMHICHRSWAHQPDR